MIKDLGREVDTEVIAPLFCAWRKNSAVTGERVALSMSNTPTIPAIGMVRRFPISKKTFSDLNLRISTFFNPEQPLSLETFHRIGGTSGDDDLTLMKGIQQIFASGAVQFA